MAAIINIPGYQIEREVGRGGMATVYLALQESLQRRVALKVMSPALSGDGSFAQRFLQEGRLIARLHHPNIVTVYELNIQGSYYYLAMEFLPGGTLEQRIDQGLSLPDTFNIIKVIAKALGYAHSQDIVHRDIKAQNILFRTDGSPVLTDFGIAKLVHSNAQLTAPGLVIGSPRYISPECAAGKKVDARADLYSLGILFYQMLTGRVPYEAEDPIATVLMHCTAPLPVLKKELAVFQPILNKLLAKEPAGRFSSAEQFIQALAALEARSGIPPLADETKKLVSTPRAPSARASAAPTGVWSTALLLKAGLAAGALVTALSTGFYLAQKQHAAVPDHRLPDQTTDTEAQQPQQHAERLLAQARQLYGEDQLDASLQRITEGLAAAPQHPGLLALRQAVTAKLTAVEAQRRQQQAEQLLAKAKQLYQAGKLEDSLKLIGEGLVTAPGQVGLLDLRKEVMAKQTAEADARSRQQQAEQLLDQARRLYQDGRLDDSLQRITDGLAAVPEHAGLLALQKAVAARQAAAAEAQRRQQQAEQLLAQARQRYEANQWPDSLKLIDQGLTAVPDHLGLLALREEISAAQRRQQQAQAEAQRRQQQAEQLLKQAKQLFKEGKLDDSLQRVMEGLAVVPEQADFLALRQDIAARQAAIAETQRRQQQAEQLLAQARQLFDEGELDDSLQRITDGLAAVPEHAGLLALQKTVTAKQAAAAEAQRRQQQAEQLLAQARQRFEAKQWPDSLKLIDQGLTVAPGHPALLALREEISAAQRRQQQAQAEEERRRQQAQAEEERRQQQAQAEEERRRQQAQAEEERRQQQAQAEALQRQQQAEQLLKQAKQLFKEGKLDDSLQRVTEGLAVAPDQAGLLALRQDIAAKQAAVAETQRRQQQAGQLLAQAMQLYQEGKLDNSLQRIADGLAAVPDHAGLLALRQEVKTRQDQQQKETARQEQIQRLLAQARQQLKEAKLTLPKGDNAYESYQQALKLDPENSDAKAGFVAIGDAYQQRAEQFLTENKLADSRKNIDAGLRVAPGHGGLLALLQQWQTASTPAPETAQESTPKGANTAVQVEDKKAESSSAKPSPPAKKPETKPASRAAKAPPPPPPPPKVEKKPPARTAKVRPSGEGVPKQTEPAPEKPSSAPSFTVTPNAVPPIPARKPAAPPSSSAKADSSPAPAKRDSPPASSSAKPPPAPAAEPAKPEPKPAPRGFGTF